jgi:lipoprotein-anchoring transpeptidase ErfK/SrfK
MRIHHFVLAASIFIVSASLSCMAHSQDSRVKVADLQIFGGMGSVGGDSLKLSLRAPSLEALMHQTVDFASDLAPGSIDVRTAQRKLYFILGDGRAIEYHVGVGREGFAWSGTNHVSRKSEWPDWRPPTEMIQREAKRGRDIPVFMAGGPKNPLGARAIYIGDTQFRIHGTTEPWTIGQAMSSGCIRMMNEEVVDLYNRVAVGAVVVVE